MQAIREYTVVRNRQLIIELPESFDNREIEVLILPKNVSENRKIFPDSSDFETTGCSNEESFEMEINKEDLKQKSKELVKLLQSWREDEDGNEQKETLEYLKKVLDEDRLSDRRLFP